MNLSRVEIHAFRSLYSAELSLKPLTLIIGPNASGKSNLFKALRFLHVGVAGDVKEWRDYDAQWDDLLWYGKTDEGARPGGIDLTIAFGESAIEYHTAFHNGGTIQVGLERVVVLEAQPPTPKVR